MTSLSSLLEPDKRPAVVADVVSFVEDTISAQSGITGMAMKGALAAATKVRSDILHQGIGSLLPDIVEDLEPEWQKFQESSETDFGAFLAPHAKKITDDILRRTDSLSESINVPALAKTYKSLRGKAEKLIAANVGELGRVLQKHV